VQLLAGKPNQTTLVNGPEHIMNQISVEANVVETEINELQALTATQAQESITELNSAQLALVGGGTAAIFLG
jgi:hypothetical protein